MAPEGIKRLHNAATELADALGLSPTKKKEWVDDYVSAMVSLQNKIDSRIEQGTVELAGVCTDLVPNSPSAVIAAIDSHCEVLNQATIAVMNAMALFHHPALRAVAAGVLKDILGYYTDLLRESDDRANKINPRRAQA